jgi:molecular chaperone DnaK
VSFDIDANGILNVTAKDRASGNSQNIQIKATTNLKEDDIKKMVNDAGRYEAEDRKRRERVEAKNNADSLVYTAEKTLREAAAGVDSSSCSRVEGGIRALKEAKDSDDLDRIKSASESLTNALYELSSSMYGKNCSQGRCAEQAAPGNDGGSYNPFSHGPYSQASQDGMHGPHDRRGGNDDIIDADYQYKS